MYIKNNIVRLYMRHLCALLFMLREIINMSYKYVIIKRTKFYSDPFTFFSAEL